MEGLWKERFLDQLETISQHVLKAWKNSKINLSQVSGHIDWDLVRSRQEYESKVYCKFQVKSRESLLLEQTWSILLCDKYVLNIGCTITTNKTLDITSVGNMSNCILKTLCLLCVTIIYCPIEGLMYNMGIIKNEVCVNLLTYIDLSLNIIRNYTFICGRSVIIIS